MVTRSSVELPDYGAVHSESEDDDLHTPLPEVNSERKSTDKKHEEEGDPEIREELKFMKAQLENLKKQIQSTGLKTTTEENSKESISNQKLQLGDLEKFPVLGNTQEVSNPTILSSWKEKVTNHTLSSGLPLKFVPPQIENGNHVVHIESNDVADLVNVWERALVVYVVGGNVNAETIRGYARKHWNYVSLPTIHSHEEGYFILRFKDKNDCAEILKGGPYFLNKAPLVVKQCTVNFDFKEEIMRVIPVWVRLPNLPLHCWGVESLSRIVSAIGVPIIADECTANQLKVSFARVLVEIDITQDFVKDIRVRDNNGHEFTQRAIPEWCPFFCRKCNKIGHECRETKEVKPHHKTTMDRDDLQLGKPAKIWIPKTIARVIEGVQSVEDLKAQFQSENQMDNEPIGSDQICTEQTQMIQQNLPDSDIREEGAWTPVPLGKIARRPLLNSTLCHGAGAYKHEDRDSSGTDDKNVNEEHQRGGNPLIPTSQ